MERLQRSLSAVGPFKAGPVSQTANLISHDSLLSNGGTAMAMEGKCGNGEGAPDRAESKVSIVSDSFVSNGLDPASPLGFPKADLEFVFASDETSLSIDEEASLHDPISLKDNDGKEESLNGVDGNVLMGILEEDARVTSKGTEDTEDADPKSDSFNGDPDDEGFYKTGLVDSNSNLSMSGLGSSVENLARSESLSTIRSESLESLVERPGSAIGSVTSAHEELRSRSPSLSVASDHERTRSASGFAGVRSGTISPRAATPESELRAKDFNIFSRLENTGSGYFLYKRQTSPADLWKMEKTLGPMSPAQWRTQTLSREALQGY